MSFRFSVPIEVRFRDLDAIGHVNNAVYLTYLEQARLGYWKHITGRTDLRAALIVQKAGLAPSRFTGKHLDQAHGRLDIKQLLQRPAA